MAPVQSWIAQLRDGWNCVGDNDPRPACSVTRRWDRTGFYPQAISSKPQNPSFIILNWNTHKKHKQDTLCLTEDSQSSRINCRKKKIKKWSEQCSKWHLAAWNNKEDGAGPTGAAGPAGPAAHTAQPQAEQVRLTLNLTEQADWGKTVPKHPYLDVLCP